MGTLLLVFLGYFIYARKESLYGRLKIAVLVPALAGFVWCIVAGNIFGIALFFTLYPFLLLLVIGLCAFVVLTDIVFGKFRVSSKYYLAFSGLLFLFFILWHIAPMLPVPKMDMSL